ncbi:MAG: hypothetical protein CVV47_00425 [Spirochaetae bacterium HGW-Spirochaetae-3]|nr:MAG: hypothetical protein CVV47_00425 [Spirochaetae bacterium HGW-Spirochaetae-3]
MNAISPDLASVLPIPLPGVDAPEAVMSLAVAGDMGFGDDGNRDRRSRWLRGSGFDPGRSASVDLVHSRIVAEAATPAGVRGRAADGMVAPGLSSPRTDASTSLVITVADCMPIFLFDSGTGAFGLLHSGWKGTGILAVAVSAMGRLYGTEPRNVSAAFGPRIGACCYVVDEERAKEYADEFGSAAVVRVGGAPRLDLVAANLGIADRLGLGSVSVADGCTCCDGRFGSYRRQGAARFTRMAAAIGYRSSP